MKKKVLALSLVGLLSLNSTVYSASYVDKQIKASKNAQKYNSVQKHSAKYDSNFYDAKKSTIAIKDPGLIVFEADKIKKITQKQYEQKNKTDNIYYSNLEKTFYANATKRTLEANRDFYTLYRVAERLIRANKLDYVNWRICLVSAVEDFNAGTTSGNLILIHTALFDSLYNNEDALAMTIAHELAHQVLGHTQRKLDLHSSARNKLYNASLQSLAVMSGVYNYQPEQSRYISKQYREMEFEADTLGAQFVARAGFDFDKSMEVVDFMNALPQIKDSRNTHPEPKKRIENLNEVKKYFLAQWVEEGKFNIYNSKPMECKVSADLGSIILTTKNKNGSFVMETPEELLKRLAYIDYKNGNMKNAIKYFSQWAEISNSYVPHLYLSYSYEYLYNQTKKPNLLEKAQKEVKTANLIAPDDDNIKKQLLDLASL